MKTRMLDAQSHSPLYKQLTRCLREDIAAGVYPVHSRIPSEQELCDTYQVSRVTVRKALAELAQDGLLTRHQGKGTYVSIPRLCKDLKDVNSFHEACRLMGCAPSTRVIHAQLTYATEEDARDLLIQDDQVLETLRLRLADGSPVMLETNRFPLSYAFLLEEDLTDSLYGVLQAHGVEAAQALHEISLTYATASQAKYLSVNEGDALMNLREIIYDQYGRPLHTSKQLIRGDRFTFRI